MSCDFENAVFDYVDASLPPDGRAAVEDHIAGCARCAALLRESSALDAALSRELTAPPLDPAFAQHLRQRLQSLQKTGDARREQLIDNERDLEAALWRREKMSIILDGAALAALTVFAGGILRSQLGKGLAASYLALSQSQPWIVFGAAVLLAAAGLWFLFYSRNADFDLQ
jgi:anti-sigma factor RsiW